MSPGPDHGTNTTEGTWQDRSIAVQRVLWGQTAWIPSPASLLPSLVAFHKLLGLDGRP